MNIQLSDILTDIVLNLLNIFILYLIVRTLVYQPVKKFMQARTERVAAAQAAAAEMETQAKTLKEEYDQKIQSAEEEGQKIIQEKTAAADEGAQAILSEANTRKTQILEEAFKRAEVAYQKKMDEMQDDMVGLACDISTKILSREMNDTDCRKIAEEFFSDNQKSGENQINK